LHQIAHVGVSPRTGPKLFGREIVFEEFQLMWSWYLIITDRQTDRQTTCDRNTALCTKVHRAVKNTEDTTHSPSVSNLTQTQLTKCSRC